MSIAQPETRPSRVHIDLTPREESIFALRRLDDQALHGPYDPQLSDWVRLRSFVRSAAFEAVIKGLDGVKDLVPSVSAVIDELKRDYDDRTEESKEISDLRASLNMHDKSRAGRNLRSQIRELNEQPNKRQEKQKLEERLNSIDEVFSKIDDGLRVIEEHEYDVTRPVVRGMSIASSIERSISSQAEIGSQKNLAEMSLRFHGFTLAGDHMVGDIAYFVKDGEDETVVVDRQNRLSLYVEGINSRHERTEITSLIYRRELPSFKLDLSPEKVIRLRETGISISDDDILAYLKGIYGEDAATIFLNTRQLPKELNGRLPATFYALLTSQPLIDHFRRVNPEKLGFYMSMDLEFYDGLKKVMANDRLVPYLLITRRSAKSKDSSMIIPEIVLVNEGPDEENKKYEPVVKVKSVINIV